MNTVLRLEGDRTVAICALGQEEGADARLSIVTSQMLAAIEALGLARVQYPLHMLAMASELTQEDYLFVQLAVLAKLGTDRVIEATRYLGAESPLFRLSHAATLFQRLGIETPDGLLRARPCQDNLVSLIGTDDGVDDPVLVPGLAVCELMGW